MLYEVITHLVTEPPEPVPAVRGAVVPVMRELVDQDPDQRPADRPERSAVDQAGAGQYRTPANAHGHRDAVADAGHDQRARLPARGRRVAPRAPDEMQREERQQKNVV